MSDSFFQNSASLEYFHYWVLDILELLLPCVLYLCLLATGYWYKLAFDGKADGLFSFKNLNYWGLFSGWLLKFLYEELLNFLAVFCAPPCVDYFLTFEIKAFGIWLSIPNSALATPIKEY